MKKTRGLILGATLTLLICSGAVYARDASFLAPSSGGGVAVADEAIKIDPKADIDIGETSPNTTKRTSIFFVNQTTMPVKIERMEVTGDANVSAVISANDCEKQGTIAALSRCSVDVSVTPSTPGAWGVDVLMTHNGAGRIARARLSGKTTGSVSAENKDAGLSVSTKETKAIDFGTVDVEDAKTVRSTLFVNDSPETITIYAIDVIEADNGLQRLDQGCAIDMELAPGASCPVTLLWNPKTSGTVSTDLIVRHSGKLGFAVVPIRGVAKGGEAKTSSKSGIPLPPSAQELEQEMSGKIPAVSSASLGGSSSSRAASGDYELHLIGTVGERAVLLKPNGETAVIAAGSEFTGNGETIKLISVSSRSAEISIKGKKKTLPLEASAALISAAQQQAEAEKASASAPSAEKEKK